MYDAVEALQKTKATVKNRAPIDLPAKPFKDNHAEQFNMLSNEILKKLPLENLKDSGERFALLLSRNAYMPKERKH